MLLSLQGEIMDPKVSVITVCYNAEEFIEQAINSVLEQTYKNIEYIVIDGNSNDNTVPIITKYIEKISYFLSEPDTGIYDAMNKGIKAASGEILYFLNSDDVFYDQYVVENIITEFMKDNTLELIYCPIVIRNPITNESFVKTHQKVTKSFFIDSSICQQGIFFKATAFKKCGMFDDSYKIVGDYEWELRAFYKYNLKRKYYPCISVTFRDGGMGGLDKLPELHRNEREKVLCNHFTKFEMYKYELIWIITKIFRNFFDRI